MNRHIVLAAVFGTAGLAFSVVSCSNDNTGNSDSGSGSSGGSSGSSSSSSSSSSSGGGSSSSSSSGGSASSSGSSGGVEGGNDSSTGCTSTQGTTMQAKWDFASSASTLNGGKGQVLMIHVCDSVEWTNDDNGIPHSVVSTGSFNFSTPMATGTTAGVVLGKVQFTRAGTFTYHCGVHLNMMIGEVIVQ